MIVMRVMIVMLVLDFIAGADQCMIDLLLITVMVTFVFDKITTNCFTRIDRISSSYRPADIKTTRWCVVTGSHLVIVQQILKQHNGVL